MPRTAAYHIDKVYYWDGEVAVSFQVIDDHGELIDQFDSYTKAERKIVELIERANGKG